MKVQDLANQLKITTKDLLRFMSEIDVKAKSGSTKLENDTVTLVRDLYNEANKSTPVSEDPAQWRNVTISEQQISLQDLAKKIEVKLSEIMKAVLNRGQLLNLNSIISAELAIELAGELGVALEVEGIEKSGSDIKAMLNKIEEQEIDEDLKSLVERPPVITIMGHVDHGKTMLLDTIRKTNVVAKESGGITQHIGAYQVKVRDRLLTFLDTPGHEAFTALRARGAQVTDIAILVVAADEGIKPQTIEAIHHAQAAGVPILVAINKMDKPGANPDTVKQQLAEHNLMAEEWGGKTIMVPVSAKAAQGIEDLLDMIVLTADMLELKANPKALAKGIVIESRLSRKKGPVATVLVKTGTLRIGDNFVIGTTMGKVRALLNDLGDSVTEVGPGTPAEILGISEVPRPGDMLEVMATEKECREIVETRINAEKAAKSVQQPLTLQALSQQIEKGHVKALNVIVKADVNGSLDAIVASIGQIQTHDISIHVIHSATGPINENDVMLAMASSAIVMAFHVGISGEAQKLAEDEGVEFKTYQIIYELVDDIQKVADGMFEPEFEEVETARIDVRQMFKFSKVGSIAGCYVQSGKIFRNHQVRVFRGKEAVYTGKIDSLKRFKEDVREVATGFECGIVLDKFDPAIGDVIVGFELKEKKRI
ncbi:MAG: translation initiation factor IF-2 [Candidatus Margulisiibacteriota bacterium]